MYGFAPDPYIFFSLADVDVAAVACAAAASSNVQNLLRFRQNPRNFCTFAKPHATSPEHLLA